MKPSETPKGAVTTPHITKTEYRHSIYVNGRLWLADYPTPVFHQVTEELRSQGLPDAFTDESTQAFTPKSLTNLIKACENGAKAMSDTIIPSGIHAGELLICLEHMHQFAAVRLLNLIGEMSVDYRLDYDIDGNEEFTLLGKCDIRVI